MLVTGGEAPPALQHPRPAHLLATLAEQMKAWSGQASARMAFAAAAWDLDLVRDHIARRRSSRTSLAGWQVAIGPAEHASPFDRDV